MIVEDTLHDYTETIAEEEVEKLIAQIQKGASGKANTLFVPLRGVAHYGRDRVHVLKPITVRNWTCTAALNDADEILTQMMEEKGWG
jgi:hypothetical protein